MKVYVSKEDCEAFIPKTGDRFIKDGSGLHHLRDRYFYPGENYTGVDVSDDAANRLTAKAQQIKDARSIGGNMWADFVGLVNETFGPYWKKHEVPELIDV